MATADRRQCLLAGLAWLASGGSPLLAARPGIAWQTDPARAWQEAKQTSLPLFLLATRSACPYCDRLKNESLADPQVAELVRDGFIALQVQAERHGDVVRKLNVTAYPTLLLLAAIEERTVVLARVVGFHQAAALEGQLRLASQRDQRLRG